MRVGEIIDISIKEIPHKSSMVIFTVGCNFKCEFCHNKYLLYPNVGKVVSVKELLEKVKSNLLVSGVSIIGGESTLQSDLKELCVELKKIGKYISIDTNGSRPEIVKELIPYINRVVLDLKGPLEQNKLEKITRVKIDPSVIIKTFNLVNHQKDIDFEIRTTYVENILNPDDIDEIIYFLRKNKFRGNFVLQQYQYSDGVGEEFKNKFQKPEHGSLINILKPYENEKLPFKIFLRDEIIGYRNIKKLFNIKLDDINER
ncbi:MAG: anaerobic ribonucleoside-triphosphate reductase activating protein [Promethearchaeota archaeon]